MIPIYTLSNIADKTKVDQILANLRLDPVALALSQGTLAKASDGVKEILADVAQRGDAAVADTCKKFDDPNFTVDQIKVKPEEMAEAASRVPADLMAALRRSIAQVREYQTHIMPKDPPLLNRPGVQLGMRHTPLDSAGLYFPGGKASYPSSLIMLAVPAQVAGVKTIAVCTPPSKYGRTDLVLAACHELNLTHVFRAGGAAAVAALAFGTNLIPRVDKIVGPGNTYVQLAKRLLAGSVGIDGYLGPSEVVSIADETGNPAFIAADLIAQAEHDPGSAFFLTPSADLAKKVDEEIVKQTQSLTRKAAIEKAIINSSAIIITKDLNEAIDYASEFAAEHVNLQLRDPDYALTRLRHAGAVFIGQHAPIAAGDYVAGPSHCLPTNTTARFTSGVSVYEFLKRSSIAYYQKEGLQNDAQAIIQLATAEHLDAHAASVKIRLK